MRCGQCGEDIHPRDLDIEALEARCRYCGWAFGKIESPYRRGASKALVHEPETGKPGVPRPACVEVSPRGAATVIRYRAHSRVEVTEWVMLLLVPILLVSAFVFYISKSLILAAVPSGLLALLFYAALAIRYYPRELVLDEDVLEVRLGRLPLGRHPRANIRQLGVTDEVTTGGALRFSLTARIDGRNVDLLHVTRPLDGLYLEQELERLLGLADEPIPGEIFALDDDRDAP